jgi:hypothetical protein
MNAKEIKMDLVKMLTDQLNLSDEQASGGAGLLFNLAKDKLSSGEFSQITSAIPGINDLISSAPKAGGIVGTLKGLVSSLGGGSSQVGDLASLASGFSKLNLDAGMIGKFTPIVLSFVQAQGGDGLRGVMEKVFK